MDENIRIKQFSILFDGGNVFLCHRRLEFQTLCLGFLHDPIQWNVGERIVWVSSTDVRMHAGKPNLANVLGRNMFLVPKYRVKSSPLIVDGKRVTRSFDIFV